MRSDEERAADISEAIRRIRRRTAGGRDAFMGDELVQIWVVHHLQIIGEATKGLSESYKAARPQVPWNSIARMRDRLIHGYWQVELGTVWLVVERDLEILAAAVGTRDESA